MIIERLIDLLKKCNQQSEVFTFNSEGELEPIIGIFYNEKTLTFVISSDDIME